MSNEALKTGLLTRVHELVGQELAEVERIFAAELAASHAYVNDVLAHATRIRGKRLRPILLLVSAAAAGRMTREHHVLAAVVEMIHTATLLHDDVLDRAETRRHVATVNARWNNETSVLFGDYLFTHAFHLAASLPSTLACRMIGRATNIVCEGELAQIHQRGNFDLTEEEYLRIIDAKTAELCSLCCLLGAHFAGADEPVVQALAQYGRQLGIAFQITDDLLDLNGTEREAGKSLGTDLEQGKLTLPLIRLLQCSAEAEAARVRQILSRPAEDARQQLEPYLRQSEALDYARARAEQFAAVARARLAGLPDSPAKRVLEDVSRFATQRSF